MTSTYPFGMFVVCWSQSQGIDVMDSLACVPLVQAIISGRADFNVPPKTMQELLLRLDDSDDDVRILTCSAIAALVLRGDNCYGMASVC